MNDNICPNEKDKEPSLNDDRGCGKEKAKKVWTALVVIHVKMMINKEKRTKLMTKQSCQVRNFQQHSSKRGFNGRCDGGTFLVCIQLYLCFVFFFSFDGNEKKKKLN